MASRIDMTHAFTREYHRTPYAAISPTQPAVSAAGKTIVITAGHTGIGYSIAENFGRAGAAHVVIVGRRQDVLDKARTTLSAGHTGTKFHAFAGTIVDEKRVKEIFASVRADIAEPDILVTSAAYFPHFASVLELDAEQLREAFATNVLGNLSLLRAFLDMPSSAKVGQAEKMQKIVLEVSTGAVHVDIPKTGAYSSSKLAFTRLMSSVQTEALKNPDPRYDLHVRSFHPGAVLTQTAKDYGMTEETRPWDSVELPGQFSVWLASGQADFLTGRFVWSNMDVVELLERKEEIVKNGLLELGLWG